MISHVNRGFADLGVPVVEFEGGPTAGLFYGKSLKNIG